MEQVNVPLVGLEIIALAEDLGDEHMFLGVNQKLIVRELWRFPRSQVGKDETISFKAGVRLVSYLFMSLASKGFTGLFQTISVNVIKPTMIDTPNAAFCHSSRTQISAAVRTVEGQ